MSLRNAAIGMNILLIMLCVGFFLGHGLPQSLMLWSSAILWFVAPIVNLLYIFVSSGRNDSVKQT
jgi:hypothetical protein